MWKRKGVYAPICALGLMLVLCLAGCGGAGGQAVLDLVPLQVLLVTRYEGAAVAVELEDESTLGVTIAQDAAHGPTADLGVNQAQEVAEFVCRHYGSIGRVDTIEVRFEIRGGGSGADATGRAAYTFARAELACSEG